MLRGMESNPMAYCTLIIRNQIGYSSAAQAVVMRCILETPATGQRRGFTDIDDLLAVLRAELIEVQDQMIPSDGKKEEI
jgi:hypothetical protein